MCAVPAVALQILYTAEGDTTNATDRLIGDGVQNGVFTRSDPNNIRSTTTDVFVDRKAWFGREAFGFNKTSDYLNTIDIPSSSTLGSAFTMAAFVRPVASKQVRRIFSTYHSASPSVDQIIFDYGHAAINGLRLYVNDTAITATSLVSVPANEYTHLAATYDNGAVKLYCNGQEVGSGTAGSGTPVIDYNEGRRIQVGEDWSWGQGSKEQHAGYMDDILIYDRALASNEIAQVARFGASVFFSGSTNYPGVAYTAEGETTNATDRLTSDGVQNGVFNTAGVTVSSANPKFGDKAFHFMDADGHGGTNELDVIILSGVKNLGSQFTLAAYVDTAAPTKHQRLFSSYPSSECVLFDFQPNAKIGFSMRFRKGIISTTATATFNDNDYHHLAATYDDGEVRLYLDGAQVGIGTNGSGAVNMIHDLWVGEDPGDTDKDEQLLGDVDDIVVLRTVLSPDEIIQLKTFGAQQFLAPPPPPWKGTLILIK